MLSGPPCRAAGGAAPVVGFRGPKWGCREGEDLHEPRQKLCQRRQAFCSDASKVMRLWQMQWEENSHTFHINYLANKIVHPQNVCVCVYIYIFFNKSILCFRGKKMMMMMMMTMKTLADCKVLQDLRRTIYSLSPCHDFSLGASRL